MGGEGGGQGKWVCVRVGGEEGGGGGVCVRVSVGVGMRVEVLVVSLKSYEAGVTKWELLST